MCNTNNSRWNSIKKVGCKTLELVKQYVDEVVTVTEDEIATAITIPLWKKVK